MNDYPSRKMDQFVVRLPDGMRDRIKVAAEANNRSMNAEIVATLEEKYPEPVDPLLKGLAEAISKAIVAGTTVSADGEKISAAIRETIDAWFRDNPDAAHLAAHVPSYVTDTEPKG